jgi:hypothetical protein
MSGIKLRQLKVQNIGINPNGNSLSIPILSKFLFAKNVERFIRCRIKMAHNEKVLLPCFSQMGLNRHDLSLLAVRGG